MNDKPGSNPLSHAGAQTAATGTTPTAAAHSATAKPMQAAATPAAPVKKKKTGLIAGIIAGVVVLVGAAVAAVLLLNMNKGDAVQRALNKLYSENAPQNVAVEGTITMTPSDDSTPISDLTINLKSDASTSSMINNTVAELSINMKDGDPISVEISELYADSGDLYFKVSGIEDALTAYFEMMGASEGVDASAYLSMFENVIEMLDDQWLKISVDELKSLTGSSESTEKLTCLADVTKEVKANNNTIKETFNKYPFISSTTENVTLASKGNPVYKVVIDKEQYKGFAGEMKESDLAKKVKDCVGESATEDEDANVELGDLPDLFVEVDGNDNFTRLYFETDLQSTGDDLEDSAGTLKFDLSFAYPANINVAEPTDYKDFTTVLQSLYSGAAYNTTYDDVDDYDYDYDY